MLQIRIRLFVIKKLLAILLIRILMFGIKTVNNFVDPDPAPWCKNFQQCYRSGSCSLVYIQNCKLYFRSRSFSFVYKTVSSNADPDPVLWCTTLSVLLYIRILLFGVPNGQLCFRSGSCTLVYQTDSSVLDPDPALWCTKRPVVF